MGELSGLLPAEQVVHVQGQREHGGEVLGCLAVVECGGRNLVVDGESALVVPPGDVAATAAALSRISADPALRSRLSTQASVEVRRYLQSAVAAQL